MASPYRAEAQPRFGIRSTFQCDLHRLERERRGACGAFLCRPDHSRAV